MSKRMNTVEEQVTPLQNKPSGRTSKKDENVVTLPPLSPENALIQQVTPLPNKPSGQTSKKDGNVVTLPLLSPKKALVHNTKILSTEETSSEEDEDSTRTTKSLHPERGVLCRIEGAKLSITVLIIRNLFEVDEEFLYFWVKALLNVWPKSVQLSATGESAIVKIPGTVDIGGLDLKDRCSRPEFLVRGERLFIYEDLPTADLQVVASATQSNTSIGEATLKSFFSSPQCVGLKNTPLMKSIYLKETHNGLPVHVITYATPQDVENVLQHGQSLSMDNWKFSVAEFYPQVGVCRQDSLVLYSDHHREYQDNQFSVLHISDVDEQKVDLKALKEYMANVNIAKGGDISSWRVTAGSNGLSSVQIIYTESDTAKRVFDFYLNQGRKVNDIPLKIEHHTPDHTEHHDDYRLRISGLIGDIDPEKLKIYLSTISGNAVTQLVFDEFRTKAVAVFQNAIDYKKILHQSTHVPLKSQLQLQVHQDYKSTNLIAKGSNLKKDVLLTSLENILRNHFDRAVNVTAEEFPDATGVWKITTEHQATEHLLNNTEELTCCESLETYIEFLGRHVMTGGPAKTENLSNVVLEPLMLQFLTETPAAFQEISEFLQSIGMSLSFDGVISLNPSTDQMSVRAVLKNWKSLNEILRKHISEKFSIYTTKMLTQEVHEKLLKKLPIVLQEQSIFSNSRSCTVGSESGYQISFVGETQLILQAKKHVLQMIREIEEEMKEEKPIQELIMPNIFDYQIEYMKEIDYFMEISRNHNLISCSGEAGKQTVTIKGHLENVAAAQREILDLLLKITNSKASIFKTEPFLRVFNTQSAKEVVMEMLSKEELKAVWVVENQMISVYSESQDLSRRALSCMTEVVWEVQYPLDRILQESEKKLLVSDEWKRSTKAIMERYEPLEIVETPGQHRLRVIGVSDNQEVILRAITLFFEENFERTISFKGVPERMAFIKKFKREIFRDLEREHCVAISLAQGDGIVEICGKATNTASCQKSLREKHDLIYHAVHTIDNPLVIPQVHEEQDFLHNVGSSTNCLVVKQKENAEIKNADKTSCRYSVTLPNGTVCEVRKDDLPSVNCDAIVNAANNHLAHNGGLARAIVNKGGDSIQQECTEFINRNGSLATGQAFTSASGSLSCKKVIHAVGPKWSDGLNQEEDLLFKCIESCFEEADKHQVKSIAIPPVSTGIFRFPLSNAVKTIVSVVETRDKQGKYLSRLIIFVDNKDDSLELFEKELTSRFKPRQLESSPPEPRENVIQKGDSQQLMERELKLSIYGYEEEDVNSCKMQIDQKLSASLNTVLWSDKPTYRYDKENIARLTEEQIERLLAIAEKLNVKLEVDKLRCDIKIVGLMTRLNPITDIINRELQQINQDRYEQNEEAWIARAVQWKYEDSSGEWLSFDTDTNKELERTYAVNPKATFEYDTTNERVRLDLSEMKGSAGPDQFRIKRIELSKPQVVPDHWAAPLDVYSEHIIGKETPEYTEVEKNFIATLGPTTRGILEIKRVQNPVLYEQYTILRKGTAMRLGKPESEIEHSPLWHGTNEDTVSLITSGKFDRGLAGRNATVLGYGCYFAKHASYFAGNTYSRPNAEGHKYIIQARVITGDYCIGDSELKTAPYKEDKPTEQFGSVVDNLDDPRMFVVFHDAAAYPEYVIKFE